MRLLVVGATGSLGRLAVVEAVQRGHDVTALVRDPARANLPELGGKVRGDVLDPVSLGPAVEGRDAVLIGPRRFPSQRRGRLACCAQETGAAWGTSPATISPAC